jgi:hypothetical protein
MKMRIQMIIEDASGAATSTDIAAFERQADDLIGLSLEEAKAMTSAVQQGVVEAQARETIERGSRCQACQALLRRNGVHLVRYRRPFGRLTLSSPRFYRCRCQGLGRQSVSPPRSGWGATPVRNFIIWRPSLQPCSPTGSRLAFSAPCYRWSMRPASPHGSVMSGPLAGALTRGTHQPAKLHQPLNEFGLPLRNPLRAVGIDGGYVKASDAPSRQEGWFEIMVGKSLPRASPGQVFAFVHRLEDRPTDRMQRFLVEQGVYPAQPTTFLSDGGDTVRQALGDFRQFGEPILDWFHIAMRMTQLSQLIKGLPTEAVDPQDSPHLIEEYLRTLRRAKAYLWHGSPHRALRSLEDFPRDIGNESERADAVQDKLEEFISYITANLESIPNYADRHRHGEPIATGFVESAVNQVVSKRMVKKQQMRWTPTGAHQLLQVRARVLNKQLRGDFER